MHNDTEKPHGCETLRTDRYKCKDEAKKKKKSQMNNQTKYAKDILEIVWYDDYRLWNTFTFKAITLRLNHIGLLRLVHRPCVHIVFISGIGSITSISANLETDVDQLLDVYNWTIVLSIQTLDANDYIIGWLEMTKKNENKLFQFEHLYIVNIHPYFANWEETKIIENNGNEMCNELGDTYLTLPVQICQNPTR